MGLITMSAKSFSTYMAVTESPYESASVMAEFSYEEDSSCNHKSGLLLGLPLILALAQ